jgi:hypothetical protein
MSGFLRLWDGGSRSGVETILDAADTSVRATAADWKSAGGMQSRPNLHAPD